MVERSDTLRGVSRKVIASVCFVFVAFGVAGTGCQSATEARFELATDIPCGQLNSIAINVARDVKAAEAQMEGRAAAAASTSCGDAGPGGLAELGSLVLYPGDGNARDSSGAVVVRAGIGTQDPYECLPPDYKGCVVAKRRFKYEPRKSLQFRINMLLACLDYPCKDENLTCIGKGTCADNDIASFLPSGSPKGDAGIVQDSGESGDAAPDSGTCDPSRLQSTSYTAGFRCPSGCTDILLCEDFDLGSNALPPSMQPGPLTGTIESTIGVPGHLGATVDGQFGQAYVDVLKLNTGPKFFAAMDILIEKEILPEWGTVEIVSWGNLSADPPHGAGLTVSRVHTATESIVFRLFDANNNPPKLETFAIKSLGWHRIAFEGVGSNPGAGVRLSVDDLTPRVVRWDLPAAPTVLRLGVTKDNSGALTGPFGTSFDSVLVFNRP